VTRRIFPSCTWPSSPTAPKRPRAPRTFRSSSSRSACRSARRCRRLRSFPPRTVCDRWVHVAMDLDPNERTVNVRIDGHDVIKRPSRTSLWCGRALVGFRERDADQLVAEGHRRRGRAGSGPYAVCVSLSRRRGERQRILCGRVRASDRPADAGAPPPPPTDAGTPPPGPHFPRLGAYPIGNPQKLRLARVSRHGAQVPRRDRDAVAGMAEHAQHDHGAW